MILARINPIAMAARNMTGYDKFMTAKCCFFGLFHRNMRIVINLSYLARRVRIVNLLSTKGADVRTQQQIKQFFRSLTLTAAVSVTLAGAFAGASASAADMTGAGATFPYPIYAKWAEAYKATTGNGLNYQSIGSGGGIKQIKAKTVDFGASDMPLKAEDLDAEGLMQFPAIMGGVVAVVNLEGVAPGALKLTGQVLADIYLGKITKWDAPEIVSLNPGLKIPAVEITVVHRADGSGTSFLFTDFLSKLSAEFKTKVGAGTAVKWAVGVGGKGNEGVAANVQRIKGAIGYVEFAYAKKNKMEHTQLKNHDGQWVQPDDETFKAAAAGADWAKTPGFGVVLTDQPGKASWPITGASFILMHKAQADGVKGKEVLKFFDWAYKNGSAMATDLEYVPLPATVSKLVEDSWKVNMKDAAGKAIW
jgi:phosphate transport system substrate-binding protein